MLIHELLKRAPPAKETAAPEVRSIFDTARPAGAPVGWSKDLKRIQGLVRRELDVTDPAPAEQLTKLLRKENKSCLCLKRYGYCIDKLLPIQGVALAAASNNKGLLAPIGVGHGKTGIDILLPMVMGVERAVLLLQPNLKTQFVERDYLQWSEHFNTPNLSNSGEYKKGLPNLHVVSYSELSNIKSSDLLKRLNPQLIIADEAHNLKDRKSARTKRFLRYMSDNPCMFVALSGTLTTKSLRDYAHLAGLALGEGSPLPLHWPTVEEWSSALDPSERPAPAGMLREFCKPAENIRQGFRRRLVDTTGVVATEESALGTSLVISEVEAGNIPVEVTKALEGVRKSWQRPDGEELTDALTKAASCRQLSAGFYYRWIWPNREPEAIIREWLEARAEWHKEIRERLKHSRVNMDSPGLLEQAAARWHLGYKSEGSSVVHPPHTKSGPEPVWASTTYMRWREIRDQAHPQSQAVWVDDFLVKKAAEWAKSNVGIVWVEFPELGGRIAEVAKAPYFGGGPEASSTILNEEGKRTIVASIKAHGTGKNLQKFSRNLIVGAPTDGGVWEQLIARTHRPGQQADEVTVQLYLHTEELRKSFRTAYERAVYMQETGLKHKLLQAKIIFDF